MVCHLLEKGEGVGCCLFVCLFFELALAWRFSVSLGSHCYVLLQPTIASLLLPKKKKKEDKPDDRVEECRKQCHVDFQLETCRKSHREK